LTACTVTLPGECDEQFNADRGVCTSVDPDDAPTGTPGAPPPAASQCKNIDVCKGEKASPAKFTSYPSYYVICIPVATKSKKSVRFYQVSVAKCPGSQEFNDETQLCQMTCAGKRGRFPDPDNCHSYFECTANSNNAQNKTCPENKAFDKDRKSCLPEFMVQGCQRTRAVEASTIAPTTTQAITASSVPTTTKNIPSVGFQCRASGVFPDESDCYRFISCSLESRSDGDYFRMRRRRCPFLTYFNPSGFCQFGFCWN